MAAGDFWEEQRKALGEFIRAQRQFAQLSLRELADLAQVSNPYLSQVERGLHEPSIRVLLAIADALNIPEETLLERIRRRAPGRGGDEGTDPAARTEAAIRADPLLADHEKEALLSVYRSYAARRAGRPARGGRG
jgi:transcriptional regulator with XRE-family HTH domain